MRVMTGCLLISMVLFGGFSHASDAFETEKVKTGILPSGGFYSMHAVDCPEQFTAEIASLNGKRRWCSLHDREMHCFSRKQDASYRACMSGAVAATDDKVDGAVKYQ